MTSLIYFHLYKAILFFLRFVNKKHFFAHYFLIKNIHNILLVKRLIFLLELSFLLRLYFQIFEQSRRFHFIFIRLSWIQIGLLCLRGKKNLILPLIFLGILILDWISLIEKLDWPIWFSFQAGRFFLRNFIINLRLKLALLEKFLWLFWL